MQKSDLFPEIYRISNQSGAKRSTVPMVNSEEDLTESLCLRYAPTLKALKMQLIGLLGCKNILESRLFASKDNPFV